MQKVYEHLNRCKAILDEWQQDEQQLEQALSKKYSSMSNEAMMAEYNRLRFSRTPLDAEEEQRCSELQVALQALGWV